MDKKKYSPIEGATENTYVPEENAEGFYRCRIINHLNNNKSPYHLDILNKEIDKIINYIKKSVDNIQD